MQRGAQEGIRVLYKAANDASFSDNFEADLTGFVRSFHARHNMKADTLLSAALCAESD